MILGGSDGMVGGVGIFCKRQRVTFVRLDSLMVLSSLAGLWISSGRKEKPQLAGGRVRTNSWRSLCAVILGRQDVSLWTGV